MSASKDKERNTWTSQFYYTDWNGEKKKKKKRGFATKKQALDYEREFLLKQNGSVTMSFNSLYEIYINDLATRLRTSSINTKKQIIEKKILPYFQDKPINEIKPSDIRRWQNIILESEVKYSNTYIKGINNQLTAIFNYATKFYNLESNPCHKAGTIGKGKAEEMQFWTYEEYKSFINTIPDESQYKIMFELLYWTGLRIGELLALTLQDMDFKSKSISINKSLQRINGKDVITDPKTPKSKRIILMPDFLCEEIKEYTRRIYKIDLTNRLFYVSKQYIHVFLTKHSKQAGIKRIRIHDLRHSHASLLIELGFSPLVIAERLGHEKIETTLNTYAHLYPNKQSQLVEKLQIIKLEPN